MREGELRFVGRGGGRGPNDPWQGFRGHENRQREGQLQGIRGRHAGRKGGIIFFVSAAQPFLSRSFFPSRPRAARLLGRFPVSPPPCFVLVLVLVIETP